MTNPPSPSPKASARETRGEGRSDTRGEGRSETRGEGRSENRQRRRRRAASVLPTLMTLGNVLCGFAAIHYAAKPMDETAFGFSTLSVAGGLVFTGMFFDAIDGTVARLTRSTSDMGAQLDSLADVITFGVAPAFMTLRLVSHYYGPEGGHTILGPADNAYAKILWAIAAFYVCCTALRLARFNAEVRSDKEEDHLYFKGLPSPGAGGTVASLIVLHQYLVSRHEGIEEGLTFARSAALGIPLVTAIVAFAMVSSIRYSHFVNKTLRSRLGFPALVRVVLPVLIAMWWWRESLAAGFVLYALSGPVMALVRPAKSAGTPAGAAASTPATTPPDA
jgi:CDP-diacylglycerol--serine O-phosphatidyltransferase